MSHYYVATEYIDNLKINSEQNNEEKSLFYDKKKSQLQMMYEQLQKPAYAFRIESIVEDANKEYPKTEQARQNDIGV